MNGVILLVYFLIGYILFDRLENTKIFSVYIHILLVL